MLRTYDDYQRSRESGKGVAASAWSAGKTYLSNTNMVMGGLASYEAKRADGQDAIEAALSSGAETVAGLYSGGSRLDQGINAIANATGAVDDHLHHEKGRAGAQNHTRVLPGVVDTIANMTPSRMAVQTAGAGTRAYYALAKAATGDMKAIDRFATDAVKGKAGMIFQPLGMAADFVGNLGSGEGAGKALDRTLDAAKGSTLQVVGDAAGDAAWKAHEKVVEVIDKDLPKLKAAATQHVEAIEQKAAAAWGGLTAHLPWR